MSKLMAVIPVTDIHNAKIKIADAGQLADGFELRLDFLSEINIHEIRVLREACHGAVIFTLRKKAQGGFYRHAEKHRLRDIEHLCELKPDYFDIEYDIEPNFVDHIHHKFPDIQLIASRHDFAGTPENLAAFLEEMQQAGFSQYKIACQANSIIDALRLMRFVRHMRDSVALTGISMGALGESSRILSPVLGNQFTYASVHEADAVAPGQLTLAELVNTYQVKRLNTQSVIYALLGDPVAHSVGHILHNQAFCMLACNAIYIKLPVPASELPHVLTHCRVLPFAGFSVTMPHKQAIMPIVDEVGPYARAMGAVNTVVMREKKWLGYNTDGPGALHALLGDAHFSALENKHLVIIGCGGAARAITHSALERGLRVTLLHRNLAKVLQVASELGCEAGDIDLIKQGNLSFSFLINTLPLHAQTALAGCVFSPGAVVMDIVYVPRDTFVLQQAYAAQCVCIPGYHMFIEQALLQLKLWLGFATLQPLHGVAEMMRHYFAE